MNEDLIITLQKAIENINTEEKYIRDGEILNEEDADNLRDTTIMLNGILQYAKALNK